VQRGDFRAGAGEFVLEHAQALGFSGLTGESLGESDAGLISFGARLVERAAQLLEPALEQQGPVRAPRAPPGWRASTRSRYAFSQGKRTMRHYSEMREFAKPGRPAASGAYASIPWGSGANATRRRSSHQASLRRWNGANPAFLQPFSDGMLLMPT